MGVIPQQQHAITDALVQMRDGVLGALDARQARVVECRFFGGMTEPETASGLGIAERTVAHDGGEARGWLHRQLSDDAV